MRKIEYTTAFRKDFKRVKKGPHGPRLDALLAAVVDPLVDDKPLPPAKEDHPLSGEWDDCRDCHLKPDLVLIYRKPDKEILQLVRLGSHSELFG
jgi:mRNA interferase YafQ